MARRRGVEVELRRTTARALAVGAQHALEVADAHVVGDEREVLAAEAGPRPASGSARCRPAPARDRSAGRRARGRAAAARPRRSRPRRSARAEAARVARGCAATSTLHPEQVLAGLGEDLREPDRALGPARRRASARPALSRNTSASSVSASTPASSAARSTSGRQRAVRSRARRRAAGRERVQHVAVAGRGAAHELLRALGVLGERVGQRLDVLVRLAGRRRDHRHVGRQVVVGRARRRSRRRSARPRPRAGRSEAPVSG